MRSKDSAGITQNGVPSVRNAVTPPLNKNDKSTFSLFLIFFIATASYRLLPLIILNPKKPVPPHLAEKFQKCFAPGVIHVDERTKEVKVIEENMRMDTVSREALRHPEFDGCVELKRVRDYFLCKSKTVSSNNELMCRSGCKCVS